MLHVNILTRYKHRLFDQHIDRHRFNGHISFHENSSEDIEWDCVVVFDGLSENVSLKVSEGGLFFVAGEPPDAITYTGQFLAQFDRTYCAHPGALGRWTNQPDQYFNNWHFGYNHAEKNFKYTFEQVRTLAPPVKHKNMSVIMSSLAYMPNHLKRLRLLDAIQQNFGDRVDVFGRGHCSIPYKESAILPYRFHLCIENCAVPDLWTEKIADPLLGYAVPVYAGCSNISKYFPDKSIVQLDVDNLPLSLAVVDCLLQMPEEQYQRRLPYLLEARERLIYKYNIIEQLVNFVESRCAQTRHTCLHTLIPNEQSLTHPLQNAFLRGKRLLYRKYFHLTNRKLLLENSVQVKGSRREPL